MTSYKSKNFQFSLLDQKDETVVIMQFPADCWSTENLPGAGQFLQNQQPSVLSSQCFNDHHLTFVEEVKKTELAHLFEHLLIDQLCQTKAQNEDADFEGLTEWNWWKYPMGSFKVTIKINAKDKVFLQPALHNSTQLMENLLLFCQKQPPQLC